MTIHCRRSYNDETEADRHPPDVSILYVEDDENVRRILCSFINARYESIPVYSTGSAIEGLELFKKHHQPIIMTDVSLDDSDGIEMARSIRTLDPDTVIIFITGCSDVERLTSLKGTGPCHYIYKPVVYHELFKTLDNYINIALHTNSHKIDVLDISEHSRQ